MCAEARLIERRSGRGHQAGLTIIEVLIGLLLSLILSLATLHLLEWSRQQHVQQSDQATAQTVGRAALDLMARDIRQAGYDPTDLRFAAVPAGDSVSIRVLADLDGDGVVGTSTETGESLTYVFIGPDGEGLYQLRRGVDLDGDGYFTSADESVAVLATHILPIDSDGDGTNEPFIAYDEAPPDTSEFITLTFGVRSEHKDRLKDDYTVLSLSSRVALRNNVLQ